jgi:hypothetical protein
MQHVARLNVASAKLRDPFILELKKYLYSSQTQRLV